MTKSCALLTNIITNFAPRKEKTIMKDIVVSGAYIKQLAAQGYNKEEICKKFDMPMYYLIANFIKPYREGQALYCKKMLTQYKRLNG